MRLYKRAKSLERRCQTLRFRVGRPLDSARRLRNGAQLVLPSAPAESLGFITSSTPSTQGDAWIGLALLAGGRDRMGQRMIAASPIHAENTEVEIVSPHHLDPETSRVRA